MKLNCLKSYVVNRYTDKQKMIAIFFTKWKHFRFDSMATEYVHLWVKIENGLAPVLITAWCRMEYRASSELMTTQWTDIYDRC